MEALKRLTLACTVALVGVACGGDDSGGGGNPGVIDGGLKDSSVDASTGPDKIVLPDGGPLPCSATTLPANGFCGGSSCQQTQADLKAMTTAGAACGQDSEIQAFCDLSAVNTVTTCSYQYISDLPNMLDAFESSTKTCSSTKFAMTTPGFSDGCLDCFTKSARCTAQNCLAECAVTTGSDACDACRIKKGCIKQFYSCAGYADPLAILYPSLGL